MLILGIVESIQSLQLLPRGQNGSGEKTESLDRITQHNPPPVPPKPQPGPKPTVAPKTRVRIVSASVYLCGVTDSVGD